MKSQKKNTKTTQNVKNEENKSSKELKITTINREPLLHSAPISFVGIMLVLGMLLDAISYDIWIPHSNPMVEKAYQAFYYRKSVNPPQFIKYLLMVTSSLLPF